jgi:glycosyltransferase involved in cell wall biosynthesis
MSTPRRRIVVIGSGTRFLSGISVYTVRLANALAARHRVAVITMRQLLPTRLYPGRARVGSALTELEREPSVRTFDGIDWYWLPSMLRGVAFMARSRPHVVVMQWWTGTVLHSYLALAIVARMLGARVVIEFHEVLDTGEARIPLARIYAGIVGGAVVRLASAFAVHSVFDRDLLRGRYALAERPIAVLPHGPHDHYRRPKDPGSDRPARLREAPDGVTNVLTFGVIRPYKGIEDLVAAFDAIPPERIGDFWLTVVGETWEGWTLPAERIAASRYRDRITFVNRYVRDSELDGYLNGADAVVLPYHRSSLSGPLHVAMGYGLPIVMTDVGGNAEAADGYAGIVLVPVRDPEALRAAIERLPERAGERFEHPHSWAHTADGYERLFAALLDEPPRVGAGDEARPSSERAA